MDYQFTRDIYGQPVARFSMEHQAVGRWFSEELSDNQIKIDQLLNTIELIENNQKAFHEFSGLQLVLCLSLIGIVIHSHEDSSLDSDHGDNYHHYEDEMNIYTCESSAECGLTDFKLALIEWQDFLS